MTVRSSAHEPPRAAFVFDRANPWIEASFQADGLAQRLADRYRVSTHWGHESAQGHDLVFLLGYTRLVSGEFLAANGLTLVVHESDLPKGRGFAPVQWQVLEGAASIPVRLFLAGEGPDEGDIVGRGSIELEGHELYEEIRARQARATFEVIERFLAAYPQVEARPQSGEPSHYPRRGPAHSELDPDKTLREQFNLLRVVNNRDWPAFFRMNGVTYVLTIEKAPDPAGRPGGRT